MQLYKNIIFRLMKNFDFDDFKYNVNVIILYLVYNYVC